ncbi:hypothetical protein Salat_1184100 [Sesamum alatum]|uniref:Uncharacterized protein n=1 Tax=Sesamum alatum TaxID=300844 RepID=A0AAE1YF04_9LAMI|nr:hypothetical protein Salat_1184100 [Sesamum alatum]
MAHVVHEGDYTTSDWSSFDISSPSPPPTDRILPQKIRGKMPRRTRASSSHKPASPILTEISPSAFGAISEIPLKMSSKSIVKTLNLLSLPEGTPFLPRFVPHPGLVFVHEKPSWYGAWKSCFFFVRKAHWEVPLSCGLSLKELPSVDLDLVKERVRSVGPLEHGFEAKALMEEDILIVAGLHPFEDTYSGPESQVMMNRAAIRKFFPKNIPSKPLSSSTTKSASATPTDIQSSGRGRSPSMTPLNLPPSSSSPSPLPAQLVDALLEPPMIEVVTSPKNDPPQVSISPSWSSPQDPSPDMAVPKSDPVSSSAFPVPMMTPQFNPKAGVSNMLKAVHRADVNFLAGRPVEGLGQLLLSHTAMTPAIIVALVEIYEKMRRDYESISLQLKDIISQLETLSREEGLPEGQAPAVAPFKASPEYTEEVFRQGTSFYADVFTVCAEQFKNLGNLPPDFDYNFLDMRVDGFGSVGGVGGSAFSEGP